MYALTGQTDTPRKGQRHDCLAVPTNGVQGTSLAPFPMGGQGRETKKNNTKTKNSSKCTIVFFSSELMRYDKYRTKIDAFSLI